VLKIIPDVRTESEVTIGLRSNEKVKVGIEQRACLLSTTVAKPNIIPNYRINSNKRNAKHLGSEVQSKRTAKESRKRRNIVEESHWLFGKAHERRKYNHMMI